MAEFTIHARPAVKRLRDFSEVVVGLTKKQAVDHAKIYLERETSLQGQSCPLGTDIISFLKSLAKSDVNQALEIIYQHNPLPAITGRFAQEPYAEIDVRNRENERISLRALECFVADNGVVRINGDSALFSNKNRALSPKIAVIGSGPSGLTAAAFLAKNGFDTHIYESYPSAGGSLRYAISRFRLPIKVLDDQISYIRSLGVSFHYNSTFGQTVTYQSLINDGSKAIFIGAGAGVSKMLNIPGAQVKGIFSVDEILMNINLMQAEINDKAYTALPVGRKVIVIGGGNAAVDCARSLARLGREVTLVVRGPQEDLQVKPFIRQHLIEEKIKIESFSNTVKFTVNEQSVVKGIRCRRLDYADSGKSDQWQLVEVKDSDFDIEADTVIVAIGHLPHCAPFKNWPELKLKRDDTIWTRKNSCMTSVDGVFAGGNITEGPGSLLGAMLSGKQAAQEMMEFVRKP